MLSFHFKEDSEDQFPFNISTLSEICKIDQQNSCSCYKHLLRRLLRDYKVLKRERDFFRDKVDDLTIELTYDGYEEFGSGIPEIYEGYV